MFAIAQLMVEPVSRIFTNKYFILLQLLELDSPMIKTWFKSWLKLSCWFIIHLELTQTRKEYIIEIEIYDSYCSSKLVFFAQKYKRSWYLREFRYISNSFEILMLETQFVITAKFLGMFLKSSFMKHVTISPMKYFQTFYFQSIPLWFLRSNEVSCNHSRVNYKPENCYIMSGEHSWDTYSRKWYWNISHFQWVSCFSHISSEYSQI